MREALGSPSEGGNWDRKAPLGLMTNLTQSTSDHYRALLAPGYTVVRRLHHTPPYSHNILSPRSANWSSVVHPAVLGVSVSHSCPSNILPHAIHCIWVECLSTGECDPTSPCLPAVPPLSDDITLAVSSQSSTAVSRRSLSDDTSV